jgi:hypothetical protein
LALCFLLQHYGFRQMATYLLDVGFFLLNLFHLSPVRVIDKKLFSVPKVAPSADNDANTNAQDNKERLAYMAYPYYYLYKVVLTGRMNNELAGAHLPRDLTATPILYLYGVDKNIQFHQDDGVCLLQQEHEQGRSRSNAIAVQDAGHWLYQQRQEYCFAQVNAFIQELPLVK